MPTRMRSPSCPVLASGVSARSRDGMQTHEQGRSGSPTFLGSDRTCDLAPCAPAHPDTTAVSTEIDRNCGYSLCSPSHLDELDWVLVMHLLLHQRLYSIRNWVDWMKDIVVPTASRHLDSWNEVSFLEVEIASPKDHDRNRRSGGNRYHKRSVAGITA
jgi:hypothetical protein